MDRKIVKYNPAFLSDQDLIDGFVVRLTEFDLITEIVRENATESNQHVLVIGPRGSGKTTLVRRVAVEVRRDEELQKKWYPIIFGEESYMVSTPGEFWLEAIFHLAFQTKDKKWKKLYEELKEENNEEHLREKALAQLLDFSDAEGKRLMLVVENMHQLLGDQISDKDAWVLRKTLLHERRIMLLGTSVGPFWTGPFEEVENEGKAMFELFKKIELASLTNEQCKTLWESITGKEAQDNRIRPIKILTGGNPRLVMIISRFGAGLSFNNLMEDLLNLVDENTEYFKSHLDNLSAQERKVYLSLAEIWDPATAKQVSDQARLAVNTTSTILGRLESRGAVTIATQEGRKKYYQIAERMYNIYHLMRRRGGASGRVRFAVKFMVILYNEDEIINIFKKVSTEAIGSDAERKKDFYVLCESLLEDECCSHIKDKLLYSVPKPLLQQSDFPESLKKKMASYADEKIKRLKSVKKILEDSLKITKSENPSKTDISKLEKQLLETEIGSYDDYMIFGQVWDDIIKNNAKAEECFRKAVSLKPKDAEASRCLANTLLSQNKHEEAKDVLEAILSVNPLDHAGNEMYGLLMVKHYKDYDKAEIHLRKALDVEPKCSAAWSNLGLVFYRKSKWAESEKAFKNALKENPNNTKAVANMAKLFAKYKPKEAEEVFREALKKDNANSRLWHEYGLYLKEADRYDEAIEAFKRAVNIKGGKACSWVHLGRLLASEKKDYDEAIKCFKVAIESYGNCTLAMKFLGDAYIQTKEYVKANEILEKALQTDKEDTDILCRIGVNKLKLNKPQEAIGGLEKILSKIKDDSDDIKGVVSFVVNLASYGFGEKSLELIEKSEAKKIFEPLVVGLKMYLGQDVKVAEEIMEVAKDVIKRINEAKGQGETICKK